MKMRILQILEKNRFNTGSVHQMFQAAAGLAELGHEVRVVSRAGAELAARAQGAGLGFHEISMRHELDFRSIRELRKLVTAFRPHVVHVHKGLSHTLALAATWSTPVPAFVVNRGVSFDLTVWNRLKYRSRRVDRIVTVCEEIKRVIMRTGKIDPSRIEVVYAGTDVAEFDPARWSKATFRIEKSISPDAFLIVQVGVRDWKGWRELVDAFAAVSANRPDARLALVACRNDEEREAVERHARSRGVGEKVLPVEVRTDMPNVLAAADCVVDASWSGTGVTGTIREAMAMARPVIASDCGGNRELVSSPRVGWLVPPRDHEAMTAALLEVMDRGDHAAETGLEARRHVVEGFSKEGRVARLEKLYGSIVRQKVSG